jgi:hypothetical protein
MPPITCGLPAITKPASCKASGGIKRVYWTLFSAVNWAAMLADEDAFNPTTQVILEFEMNTGGTWKRLDFEKKQGSYSAEYTEDTDSYALNIPLVFEGKENARKNALTQALRCCDIVALVIGNNGEQRVFGVDFDGDFFDTISERLKVGRHLDTSGVLGTDKARDEVDLTGEALFAPLFANVVEADLPLT